MAIVLRPLPEDKAVAELRRQVQTAVTETRAKIRAQVLSNKPIRQLRRLETELRGIRAYLDQYLQLWTITQVPSAWQRGYGQSVRVLKEAGASLSEQQAFVGVNVPAVNLVAENLVRQFEVGVAQQLLEASAIAGRFVGRRLDDIYRRLGLEAGAQRILTGRAYTVVAMDEMAKLEAEGILFFTDAANRRWSLDAYTQMVSRTVLRETEATALITGLTDNGHDLVYVPPHAPTCRLCVQVQDRVYSITGLTPGYPQLPHWPPHPNCRHPVQPYFPEADSNTAATRERSGRPFEDSRSLAEIEAYDLTQERNRLIRQERQLAQLKAGGTVPLGKRGEELVKLARAGDPEAKRKLVGLKEQLLGRLDDRLRETRRKLRELPVPKWPFGGLRPPMR